MKIPERVRRRAYERHDVDDRGCWISRYSVSANGYSQLGWHDETGRKRMTGAHRAAWEFINGPIPGELTVDHMCKTIRCVNPDHLRLLSRFENARRRLGRDWPLGFCAKGHPNKWVQHVPGKKTRTCLLCLKDTQQRVYAKKKAAARVSDE